MTASAGRPSMGGAKPRATAPPVGAAGVTDGAAGQRSSGRTGRISPGAAGGVAAGNVDGDGPNMNGAVAGATAGAAAAAGAVNVDGAVPKENTGRKVWLAAGEALLACCERPPNAFTLLAAAGPPNGAELPPSVVAWLCAQKKSYKPARFERGRARGTRDDAVLATVRAMPVPGAAAAPNSASPVAGAAPKDSPVDGAMPNEGAGVDAPNSDGADDAPNSDGAEGAPPNKEGADPAANPTVAGLAAAPAH
jgi:hypothetical protein